MAGLLACGGAPAPGTSTPTADGGTLTWTPGQYPLELITEAQGWRQVLPTTWAGTGGHSGQRVRGMFNAVAAPTYDSMTEPVQFAVGSVIAKAVVAGDATPLDQATRYYFMRKEPAGWDPANNDWSWAVANRSGATWSYSTMGRSGLCSGCHQADARWDFARTVQVFRTQTPP
ncbi:MAG: hypothetical protein JNJ54_26660 [Myxococcaceae bacterium]|nr:hypothetical protein [Myxococcaceae bacterium]